MGCDPNMVDAVASVASVLSRRSTSSMSPVLQAARIASTFFMRLIIRSSHSLLFPPPRIFLVFETDEFHQFGIRLQPDLHVHRPRLRICLGIVDRNLNIHVSENLPP